MDYQQSLNYLFGLQQFGIKLGLENINQLLERLGHPQRALSIVHIAGTNGKGSTAAALASILSANGIRTGLYTSPHLQSFTERIQVDGHHISEQDVVELTLKLKVLAADIPATFFEFTTALALEYFRRREVEWVILETGLGGRLDATNAVTPALCLVTPISRDHEQYLGSDLASIAAEKAGIFKPGVPVLTAPQVPEVREVLIQTCRQLDIPLRIAGSDWQVNPSASSSFSYSGAEWALRDLPQSLPGRHQLDNLGLALAAAEALVACGCAIDVDRLPQALAQISWPGRLEWCAATPRVLLDGAHNPAGAETLSSYLQSSKLNKLLWVAAFKEDKSWEDICGPLLPQMQHVYAAPLAEQASVNPNKIAMYAQGHGVEADIFCSASEAVAAALAAARPDQVVLVAGSLFLIAEVRPLVLFCEENPKAESVMNVG